MASPSYGTRTMNDVGHLSGDSENRIRAGNTYIHNYNEPNRNRCLVDLRLTDPRVDKTRIKDTKGGLLTDLYKWILGHRRVPTAAELTRLHRTADY
ncbi:hypothetical protein EDB81DRAFT_140255 [Dactylonectria macrodidyma]|uniref:Uncharacterized protein n=1 Tax=Dactylonectria macrodidyma TaxID=307937 RepID=A0A9P9IQY2_9HYPO|nr:hypothetical protein EDB81DRAFT_140255 [Dactylonectria macrodidyma]